VAKSKIEWTDITINPIVGCTKVSPGCQNCYAEKMAKRLKAMGRPQYQTVVDDRGWTGQTAFHKPALEQIRKAPVGKMIFIGSMGDIFHENVPEEWLTDIFREIGHNSKSVFQILTKRPERMAEIFPRMRYRFPDRLNHIWLGVTTENQEQADKRIPILMQIPAAKKFVSIEPMLGEIDLIPIVRDLDWVLVGCESGPRRRGCDPEWIDKILDQCRWGWTPCFVKQVEINGKISHNMNEWPESIKRRELPE